MPIIILMFRVAGKLLVLVLILFAGSAGVYWFQDRYAASRQIAKLEAEKQALQQVVKRLGEETRVAEMIVTEQKPDSANPNSGVLRTTILFVEYTKGGESLPPKSFTIEGKLAHVDAMVIKFDHDFVAKGDALRGHSIALFTKIYGDGESPAKAATIDEPGKIPDIYRDAADPRIEEFEQSLWKNFWRLTDDEPFRKEKGVRVAMGQGVWGMFEPGKLYRITLENNGGLNLTVQPMPGIFKAAMKERTPS